MYKVFRYFFIVGFLCKTIIAFGQQTGASSYKLVSTNYSAAEIIDNRMFIEVKIETRYYHFIVDCGGINVLNWDAAVDLGLNISDITILSGAGAGTAKAGRTVIDSVVHSSVVMYNQRFRVINLNTIRDSLKLPYLDGLVGAELMNQFITQLDYPNSRIRFLPFDANNETDIGDTYPFSFYRNQIPMVEAKADGIKGKFIFDTGDRSSLTLLKHFSDSSNISTSYQQSEPQITGYGVGGPVIASKLILGQFELLGKKINNINTRIPTATTGAFARTDIDGSIGGGLLKEFIVTFDYSRKMVSISK